MTVKVLRADSGIAAGVVRAIDQKGSPIGEARYTFSPQDRGDRSRVRSSGGVAQRHRAP